MMAVRRTSTGSAHTDSRPVEPFGPRGPAGVAEHPVERPQRLVHRLDPGDPHRDARLAQRVDVRLPVLLGVGEHHVGGEAPDGVEVGVLGAPHPGHVQVRRVRAPVGRADQRLGEGRGHGLGERGHQRHDPPDVRGNGDGYTGVVKAHTRTLDRHPDDKRDERQVTPSLREYHPKAGHKSVESREKIVNYRSGDRWLERESLGFDPNTPNVARLYDYYLGGKDHFPADRRAAERLLRVAPEVRTAARANRAFLGRAVRFLAGAGVTQFLDIGTGLPTQDNVHEVARAVAPESRWSTVDHDPVVLVHARALLAGSEGITVVDGDLRDPHDLLKNPDVVGALDFDQPVGVLLVAIMHYIGEADDPLRIMAAIRESLAPAAMSSCPTARATPAPPPSARAPRSIAGPALP